MVSAIFESSKDFSVPNHSGDEYTTVLKWLHRYLSPKTYLEIGSSTGESLRLASCRSIAVDPGFNISQNILGAKSECHCYQISSDQFFDRFDPTAIMNAPLDLAFLDGLHWAEFLLRDFINVERCAKPNSVIAMHDCLPTDFHVARRNIDDNSWLSSTKNADWWAGDVWKVVRILKTHRKDLRIYAFNAPPTGLVLITGLKPKSEFHEQYFDLVSEMHDLDLSKISINGFFESLSVRPTSSISTFSSLAQLFWL